MCRSRHIFVMTLLLCLGMITQNYAAQKGALTTINFCPQWTPQSQFAGYIVGIKKGFYREAGIQLNIKYPFSTDNIITYLDKGKAQIITMNLLQAMLERSKGKNLVNLMQTSQQSGLLIVAKYPLEGLKSLKGMKVGRWRMGHSELIDLVMREGDLQLDWEYFNNGINLFLSGAVQATTAMTYNEYISLFEAGMKIKEKQLIRFADIGYNIPEDGIYVTESYLKNNRALLKKFIMATRKSWEWTRAHPQEALNMTMEVMRRLHIPCNQFHQEGMLKEVLRLQVKQGETQPTYVLNENDFHFVNVLLERGGFLKMPLSFIEFKPKL